MELLGIHYKTTKVNMDTFMGHALSFLDDMDKYRITKNGDFNELVKTCVTKFFLDSFAELTFLTCHDYQEHSPQI